MRPWFIARGLTNLNADWVAGKFIFPRSNTQKCGHVRNCSPKTISSYWPRQGGPKGILLLSTGSSETKNSQCPEFHHPILTCKNGCCCDDCPGLTCSTALISGNTQQTSGLRASVKSDFGQHVKTHSFPWLRLWLCLLKTTGAWNITSHG